MVLNILSKARTPTYDGTEDTSWGAVDKSLSAYITAYNAANGAELDPGTPVNELPSPAKGWIAGRSLLGNPAAETVAELIHSPVVNPATGALNSEALRNVLSADIPEESRGVAQGLLDSAFGTAEPRRDTKAVINSRTSGKFRRVKANGRDHIVTNMRPIVGDSVMNRIFYPDDEVHRSFEQLNNLPAPAGHPEVEGRRVSAYDPMAVNAHNIGGFVRKPTKSGRYVNAEFWLDEETAGASEAGRETKRRIEAGESVGVSTGLELRLVAGNGVAPDGERYTAVGRDYKFDHVAVLLTAPAAGAHVGTALITNAEGEEVAVGNVTASELHERLEDAVTKRVGLLTGSTKGAWVREVELDESFVVYRVYDRETDSGALYRQRFEASDDSVSLLGDPQEVTEQTTYVPVVREEPKPEEKPMELTMEKVTEWLAGQGLTPVSNAVKDQCQAFEATRGAFEAWQKAEAERLDGKRSELVENSELSAEQAALLDEPTVDAMLKTAKRVPVDNRARPGAGVGTGAPAGDGEQVTSDWCRSVMAGTAKKEG